MTNTTSTTATAARLLDLLAVFRRAVIRPAYTIYTPDGENAATYDTAEEAEAAYQRLPARVQQRAMICDETGAVLRR